MRDKSMPVITANYCPLRFITRGETDHWCPTLDEINSRSYDYVKLHRMSTYLDVGIAPYSMGVCFDGTLVLPAIPRFRDRNVAVMQFNKTISELLLGGIYCEAVSPDDVGYGSASTTAYVKMHGGARGPIASFHQAARTKHIGTLDVIRLAKPDKVTTAEMHSALTSGRELVDKIGEVPGEQVLYGATFYVRKQWAESLIHLWTACERIIEIAWHRYVVSSTQVSKTRRAFLDDSRTWTAAAKLEVLYQKNLLPQETYTTLDSARKARNEFAHRGIIPTKDSAFVALHGCLQLLSLGASDFQNTNLIDDVIHLVDHRCDPQLFPQKTEYQLSEVSHWLAIPPVPGDESWGEKKYEIIEDLCLRPLKTDSIGRLG